MSETSQKKKEKAKVRYGVGQELEMLKDIVQQNKGLFSRILEKLKIHQALTGKKATPKD